MPINYTSIFNLNKTSQITLVYLLFFSAKVIAILFVKVVKIAISNVKVAKISFKRMSKIML